MHLVHVQRVSRLKALPIARLPSQAVCLETKRLCMFCVRLLQSWFRQIHTLAVGARETWSAGASLSNLPSKVPQLSLNLECCRELTLHFIHFLVKHSIDPKKTHLLSLNTPGSLAFTNYTKTPCCSYSFTPVFSNNSRNSSEREANHSTLHVSFEITCYAYTRNFLSLEESELEREWRK